MSNESATSIEVLSTTTQAVRTVFQQMPGRMTSQQVYDACVEQQLIDTTIPIHNVRSSIHQLEKRNVIKRLPVSETGPLGHRMKLYMLAPPLPQQPPTSTL